MSEPGNIADALAKQAHTRPEADAILEPIRRRGRDVPEYKVYSYRELNQAADEIALGLIEYGFTPGSRVAVMVKPGFDLFALAFGLFRAGLVPVLIDPGIGIKRMGRCLEEAQVVGFCGIPSAHTARILFRWARGAVERLVTVGRRWFWGGQTLHNLRRSGRASKAELPMTRLDDVAAILFTSGSTGSPKGVIYQMRHFLGQVELLGRIYGIEPGEVDLPTFPLFALFDPALGMTTIIPFMDPTKPAKADPQILAATIQRYKITNMFGSPALLNTLSRHCVANQTHLSSLRRVISAGAAVPSQTIARLQKYLPVGALIHTPYGATECLPVATADTSLLLGVAQRKTAAGAGVCVGSIVEPNDVRIIQITDEPIDAWSDDLELARGEIGEITVIGPTTTQGYLNRPKADSDSKIRDPRTASNIHRMGDVGYIDDEGLLWFCGRKRHRVVGRRKTYFTVPIEAVFNPPPAVFRSALIGREVDGEIRPVLCVEVEPSSPQDWSTICDELAALAASSDVAQDVTLFFRHDGFPVDIRHNAKIEREQLRDWVASRR